MAMNANEKKLRYQGLAKLNQLQRNGAKPAVVEQLRRSIAGNTRVEQKGKVYQGSRRKP